MAQFDVYSNPSGETSEEIPYLLDVQSDLLDPLSTRVVVPLVRVVSAGVAAKTLMPQFEVNGVEVVMSTPELAGMLRSGLGRRVGSLASRRSEILAALDVLFTGV
jgi:toxin CcdB